MTDIRLHPLHSPEWVCQYVAARNEYPGERCTGRSTAQALEYIAQAIRNPYKRIKFVDHYGTRYSNSALRQTAQQMVQLLNLKHFTFTEDTIQFG